MPPQPDATAYAGPLTVTVVYVLLYYAYMIHVARTKTRLARAYADRGEKFDRYFSQDRAMLAADRVQLNMLEQMPPFLILLWLNAVFVDITWATVVGGIYVASRALYPVMVGGRMGRGVRPSILVATGPGYLVVLAFAGALVWAMLS